MYKFQNIKGHGKEKKVVYKERYVKFLYKHKIKGTVGILIVDVQNT